MKVIDDMIEELKERIGYSAYEVSGVDDMERVQYWIGKVSALQEFLRFVEEYSCAES